MAEGRQPVIEQEDLHEDRRVANHLDVDRGELAHDRDPVRARRSEDEADRRRAGDSDRGHLERELETFGERIAVVPDDRPVEAGEKRHLTWASGTAAPQAAAPARRPYVPEQSDEGSLPIGYAN